MNSFIKFAYYLYISKIRTPNVVIKGGYAFHFSNFLVIGLCNSSANSWCDVFSFLTATPEVFSSKKLINHWSKTPLIFISCPQALYENPGCLICISGINLSPGNKKLFTIYSFYILYSLVNTSKIKEDLLKEFYLKVSLFLRYLIIH